MLNAAAQNGWMDRDLVAFESLLSFKRAGCDGVQDVRNSAPERLSVAADDAV